MKRFLTLMSMVFCAVLAVWVAFRLAPETWAVLSGLLFGLIATLPMCAIVIVMLLRGGGDRSRQDQHAAYAQTQHPAPQPYIILNADPRYGNYVAAPHQPAPRMPVMEPYAQLDRSGHSAAPRAYFDRTSGDVAPFGARPTYRWADEPERPSATVTADEGWDDSEDENWTNARARGGGPRILGH